MIEAAIAVRQTLEPGLMESVRRLTAAAVAEHIRRDLLDWHLPWHEQVEMPWAQR